MKKLTATIEVAAWNESAVKKWLVSDPKCKEDLSPLKAKKDVIKLKLTDGLYDDPGYGIDEPESSSLKDLEQGNCLVNFSDNISITTLRDELNREWTVENVQRVYVNGEAFEPASVGPFNKQAEKEWNKEKKTRKPFNLFCDCYNYAMIDLEVKDPSDGQLRHFFARKAIQVGSNPNAVKTVEEILTCLNGPEGLEFLLNGPGRSRSPGSTSGSGPSTRQALLMLLRTAVNCYRRNLCYFRTESRSDLERVERVEPVERLRGFAPRTLPYTIRHPEYWSCDDPVIPVRTLGYVNAISRDTYENRVVLGFLDLLRRLARNLDHPFVRQYMQIPDNSLYGEGDKNILEWCRRELDELWGQYRQVLPVKPERIDGPPRSLTPAFRMVRQYRDVYRLIKQLFSLGLYDLDSREMLLAMARTSTIYESYVLYRVIQLLGKPSESRRHIYPMKNLWSPGSKAKWSNIWPAPTVSDNTFVFRLEKQSVTLYYQPVLYPKPKDGASPDEDTPKGANGIGLWRSDGEPCFYTPDYVLKLQGEDGSCRYLILDAKFKDERNVWDHELRGLTKKYLENVSPVKEGDTLCGLFIPYGYDGGVRISRNDGKLVVYGPMKPSDCPAGEDFLNVLRFVLQETRSGQYIS